MVPRLLIDTSPLRESPAFARLWWGLGLSSLGTQLTVVAVGLEVYDLTGTLGYDVYGYSQNQIINDVLDLYERHLAFLYMQQTQPGDSDLSDGAEPERTWSEDN